jgi:hypothetical protein
LVKRRHSSPLLSHTQAYLHAGYTRLTCCPRRASAGMAASSSAKQAPQNKLRKTSSTKQGQPLLLAARLRYMKPAPERFWIPIQTYAADGGARPNSGGTPFRQPSPAYPSAMRGRHRRSISARKLPELVFNPETHFSKAQLHIARTKKRQRTASLGDLAEPIYYSKHIRTSSTRVFASQCYARADERVFGIRARLRGGTKLSGGDCSQGILREERSGFSAGGSRAQTTRAHAS